MADATGNQAVLEDGAALRRRAGSKAVRVQRGPATPNGVLSQTFATTPGQAYALTFDAGAMSFVNQDAQQMLVTVQGMGPLLSQTVSVAAPGNGSRYVAQSFPFVADSATTTLTFRDTSPTTSTST